MKMMHPSVKLKMIEVNLLLCLWDDKFLEIKSFIDFFSKKSKVFTIKISKILCKFIAIKASPIIIPRSSMKNISKSSPRLKSNTANGSKKYIETPAPTAINPKSK